VMGLAVDAVDTECSERGLAFVLFDEIEESGLTTLGDAPLDLDFPCRNSKYSGPEGFQEDRWKLFFLRTLALNAALIALVASCVLASRDEAFDTAEAMLGAGDLVISRRGSCVVDMMGRLKSDLSVGSWVSNGSNSRRKCGGEGEVEEHVW
jgi:hypothetical protein